MTTSEKVAYLKGLAEGYGTDPATKEGKLLGVVLDILEDLALDQEDLAVDIAELSDGLDAVSDDLEDVEEILFGDVDDEDDEDDADDLDDLDDEDMEIADWDGKTVYYDIKCPACGETVTFDEHDLAKGSIPCPACGEILEFELTDQDQPDPETK